MISIEDIFEKNEKIILDDKSIEKFLNGVKLNSNLSDGICRVYDENEKFIGIAEVKDKKIRRDVIITLN